MSKRLSHAALAAAVALYPLGASFPFAFIFAGEANGVDVVTHPIGYTGTGGNLTISVGIDPTSVNASDMVVPTQNAIQVLNGLASTTGNLLTGASTNVPFTEYDFESVLLHELGHSMGLAHCNLGAGAGADSEFTNSTDGVNNAFDADDGVDNIDGSDDDVRGDDVNLNYFKQADNNPFTIAGTIDATTYSRDILDLPVGDLYSANASQALGNSGLATDTEAVMQQGSPNGQAQRTLAADDVAGLRYAMTGVDEAAGTSDDYTYTLTYAGLTTTADITLDFDASETGFAVSQSSGSFLGGGHVAITGNNVYFHPTVVTWFFNQVALPVSLVAFDAAATDVGVELAWRTASEVDHDHFRLERSRDLRTWTRVARVRYPVREDATGARDYRHVDADVTAGDWYYRLTAVGTDGQEATADPVAVRVGGRGDGFALRGFPLLEEGCAELVARQAGSARLALVDAGGRPVAEWRQRVLAGPNELDLSRLRALPNGAYFLRVALAGEAITERVTLFR